MSTNFKRAAWMLGLGATAVALFGQTAEASWMLVPPDNFSSYLTFIGAERYDPNVPHPDPRVTGCAQGLCDGGFFQAEIQGRSPGEIAQQEANAKAFFAARFGVHPDDPAYAGRILFRSFTIDPRGGYHAHVISGRYVPPQGLKVYDGGFTMLFLDPAGVQLGGEFSGRTAPFGSFVVIGEYAIEKRARGRSRGYINISYRSGSPVEFTQTAGMGAFSCDLAYGRQDQNHFYDLAVPTEGLAQGIIGVPAALGDGTVIENLRNSLTFSQRGGL